MQRPVHKALDIMLDTHAEMAGAVSPEARTAIDNARQDLHLFLDQVVHAARGQDSDVVID